jgi:hypothetical protein
VLVVAETLGFAVVALVVAETPGFVVDVVDVVDVVEVVEVVEVVDVVEGVVLHDANNMLATAKNTKNTNIDFLNLFTSINALFVNVTYKGFLHTLHLHISPIN